MLEEMELVNGELAATHVYSYGHDLIAQEQVMGEQWVLHFYGYDGHGSVRYLMNEAGAVTDTYDYDAYGILIAQGTISQNPTPNVYLYTGEQWDADLGFYYLRARYNNPQTGRFWTRDNYEGNSSDPSSLHKFLYCQASPMNMIDPTGQFSSWEQFLGFEAEDAIVEDYVDWHPWVPPGQIVSSARIPVKSREWRFLKPDILNLYSKEWLEIKPLSPSGVAKGIAKFALNSKLLKGYTPDATWIPTPFMVTETGVEIVVVNCGGVVYYVEKAAVDFTALLAGARVGMGAKQLLDYVTRRSLTPALAYATRLAGVGKGIDTARLGQAVGCATLLSVLAGGVL